MQGFYNFFARASFLQVQGAAGQKQRPLSFGKFAEALELVALGQVPDNDLPASQDNFPDGGDLNPVPLGDPLVDVRIVKNQGEDTEIDQVRGVDPLEGAGDDRLHPEKHGADGRVFPPRSLAVGEAGNDDVVAGPAAGFFGPAPG